LRLAKLPSPPSQVQTETGAEDLKGFKERSMGGKGPFLKTRKVDLSREVGMFEGKERSNRE